MENQQNDLAGVVDALFANATTSFTASNGTVIEFRTAKLKEIAAVTRFLQKVADRVPKDKAEELLSLIVNEQERLMGEGKSVYDLQLNATALLEKALGNHSLLLGAFTAIADILPEFISILTNISEEQFNDLPSLDEQLVVALGIFMVNYAFFTQSLPPILKRIIASMKLKRLGSASKQHSTAVNTNPATK